jgi:hypothetical protein
MDIFLEIRPPFRPQTNQISESGAPSEGRPYQELSELGASGRAAGEVRRAARDPEPSAPGKLAKNRR